MSGKVLETGKIRKMVPTPHILAGDSPAPLLGRFTGYSDNRGGRVNRETIKTAFGANRK